MELMELRRMLGLMILSEGDNDMSSYTLVGSAEYTIVGTTSRATAGVVEVPYEDGQTSTDSSEAMLYIRVRDKAGKRPGYTFGTDTFFFNLGSDDSRTKVGYNYKEDLTWATFASDYGVYPGVTRYSKGYRITTYSRQLSSYVINGTYKVEIYRLKWPDGKNQFD